MSKRRGNKSHKVPNVKLRPINGTRQIDVVPTSMWVADSQMDDDTFGTDSCPRPFKGLLLCATGEMDKGALFKQAVELGAAIAYAFTDEVTHLIAAEHGSEKYSWAIKCRVPILKPSWITECYQTWLKGDDIDIPASIVEHRLPLFSGVVLSLSGINDIKRRTQISKLLAKEEGSYVKVIERPVKITHLLCSGTEETEQLRRARSFVQKGEAKIHIIWEEWFWDSAWSKGRWNEGEYDIETGSQPERKEHLAEQLASLSVTETSSMLMSAVTSELVTPRPQRQREPAQEEDEVASVRRHGNDAMRVWQSVLKPRGYELAGNKLVLSPSKALTQRPPPPAALPPRTVPAANNSVITSFIRDTTSFARPEGGASGSRLPFRRIPTAAENEREDDDQLVFGKPENYAETSAAGAAAVETGEASTDPLFSGLRFRVLGEADSPAVRSAVEEGGGQVVQDGTVDYIIVRLVNGGKFYQQTPERSERFKFRTECWLERCMFEERLCMPGEHIAMTPLKVPTPVPGAEEVDLSFSGLDESEACWTRRLSRALGISIAPSFSRRSTHLLCPSATGAKFDKALEWHIPVVNMGWLDEMATTGIIPPTDDYSVGDLAVIYGSETMDQSIYPPPQKPQVVGNPPRLDKGKVREMDYQMVDTTGDFGAPEVEVDLPYQASVPVRVPGLSLPSAPDEAASIFGKASYLLDASRQEEEEQEQQRPLSPSSFPPPATQPDPEQRPPGLTPAQIEQEMLEMELPSSRSPSPLKLPPPLPPKPQAHKALEKTMASVLGKRPTSNMDDFAAAPARPGKRTRPMTKARRLVRETSGSLYELATPDNAQHSSHRSEAVSSVKDDGIRVMYEDPGQRESRQQVLRFADPSIVEEEPPKKGQRCSTRMAGF